MTLFTPRQPATGRDRSSARRGFGGMRTDWDHPLGRNRRLLALFVILAGIFSVFVPLVTIDPPVAGAAQWSAFEVVHQMYGGRLPQPTCERCGEPMVRALLALPLDVSVSYLMLALGVVALCFPESPRALRALAFVGGVNSGFAQNRHATAREFSESFYGHYSSYRDSVTHVHCGWLTILLLCGMAMLFYISITPALDRPHGSGSSDHPGRGCP